MNFVINSEHFVHIRKPLQNLIQVSVSAQDRVETRKTEVFVGHELGIRAPLYGKACKACAHGAIYLTVVLEAKRGKKPTLSLSLFLNINWFLNS